MTENAIVDDLTSKPPTGLLTIGKSYLVPCLRVGAAPLTYARPGEWVPVLLPEHEDSDIIKFPYLHFHLDWRFLSKRQYRLANIAYAVQREHGGRQFFDSGITYKRKKMLRESPAVHLEGLAPWFTKLKEKYKDSCLVKDMKCPHRGIDLSGCKPVEGIITCPAHGLRWNAETGRAA